MRNHFWKERNEEMWTGHRMPYIQWQLCSTFSNALWSLAHQPLYRTVLDR